MNEAKIVVYFDQLGFSNSVLAKDSGHAALNEFFENESMLHFGVETENLINEEIRLKNKNDESKNTFDHVIMFSDSIFLSGVPSISFFTHLASFLGRCWRRNTSVYWCEFTDADFPFVGREIKKSSPILFRGGICIGSVSIVKAKTIINGKEEVSSFLFGPAYVNSCKIESQIISKGPRIFIDELSAGKILEIEDFNSEVELFFQKIDSQEEFYEFLWPAFYLKNLNSEAEIYDMLIGAINYYKVFKGEKFEKHYEELINLFFKSSTALCNYKKNPELLIKTTNIFKKFKN